MSETSGTGDDSSGDAPTSAVPGTCPVCMQDAAGEEEAPTGTALSAAGHDVYRMTCPRCGMFRIGKDDYDGLVRARDRSNFPLDAMHLVSAYLREMTIAGHGGLTLNGENARTMVKAAPRTITERIDRLLLNIAGMSDVLGAIINLDPTNDFVLAYGRDAGELTFFMAHLFQEGLAENTGTFLIAELSVKGWQRVETLRTTTSSYTQAFVAMSFDPALEAVYEEAIAPAVEDAGYRPLLMSRSEHADQVDDRIVLELNRSRFVVADFTQHRPSVYFEAGYAVGRGLPVIWTCRADDYGSAHFDTRQYNHIVWSTPAELRERLFNRIKVVVG